MNLIQRAGKNILFESFAVTLITLGSAFIAESKVIISELSVNPADGSYPWVELVNTDSEKYSVSGYQLVGSASYSFDKKFPDIAAGKYIVVFFDGKKGITSNKNSIHVHAPKVADPSLFAQKGELAIVGTEGVAAYVAWGNAEETIYKRNAVANSAWHTAQANLPVESDRVGPGKSIKKGGSWARGKDASGQYIDEWNVKSPDEVSIGGPGMLSAPNLYVPSDGVQITELPGEKIIRLIWHRSPEYSQYRIQICSDALCTSVLQDKITSEDYFDVADLAANSVFYWKVSGITSNKSQSSWSETRKVIYGYPGQKSLTGAVTEQRVLNVPALAARKDTRLLCLDTYHSSTTDGCDLGNTTHPWDNSHVAAAHYCECGSWRCWAVGAAMMNRYYGGNVSIDEIKFQIKGGGVPEDDFPHGSAGGASYLECANADAWALQITNAALNRNTTKPTEAVMRNLIDNNRPLYWIDGGHVMVCDGYRVNSGVFEIRMLNTDNDGTIQWRTLSTQLFAEYHCPNVAGTVGRATNPLVSTDSDGDGMVDFDEINRFSTDRYLADTDADGIKDKIEVYSYAQARNIEHGQLDQDADGKRPERDFDTDGGRKPDGYEDANANGVKDAGESDIFLSTDDGAIPNDITISNQTISSNVTYLARNSITIGPSVIINSPANVVFSAGNKVTLNSGITQNSGKVDTRVDPNLR